MADLDAGATGAMTGGGYPDGIRQITDAFAAGRREAAVEAYERWLPLINYENRQCGLLACKALMQEGGVIAHETARLPLQPAAPGDPGRADRTRPAERRAGAALGAVSAARGTGPGPLPARDQCAASAPVPSTPQPRTASRARSGLMAKQIRTRPSPSGPKAVPGATPTLASRSRRSARSRLGSSPPIRAIR